MKATLCNTDKNSQAITTATGADRWRSGLEHWAQGINEACGLAFHVDQVSCQTQILSRERELE